MLYRPYAPADFDPLYAAEEACFQPPFRFSRRYMRELVRRSTAATWIAEEAGQLAGFAIVSWAEQPGGQLVRIVTAYIETIEVAPAWRGRGVADELMRLVEGSARAAGAVAIWLHVDTENAVAIRLYETHGYRYKDTEENFYPRGRAALVYVKPLQSAQDALIRK